MNYLEALRDLHNILKPDLYIEIGSRKGQSLSLSKCNSIAIDPEFEIVFPLHSPTRIFKEKSDDFFDRDDCAAIIDRPFDLAFIDGMHQVEFALRDFINLERFASDNAVIVIDDILPEDMAWATRDRQGQYWTGDVYRLIPILREYRPDLDITVFDIEIKGLAVVSGLDPQNTILSENLQAIEAMIGDGKWVCENISDLRDTIEPRPVGELQAHVDGLASR